MKRNTLIGLAVVALALFSYIGLVEQHSLSTGDVSGREARLLPRLVRARVEQLTLDHGEQHLVIRRVRAEMGELGEWRLVEPVDARADQDAVASLLGSLDWADVHRRLGAVSSEDLRHFGMDSPRAQIELKVADETITLALGGPAATGDGVYARVDEGDAAVVGQDLLEALTADVGHFRDKALFAQVDLGQLEGLHIEREGDDGHVALTFARESGRFWITGANKLMAADTRVREAARSLAELSAERFVDTTASAAGLDAPRLRVRIDVGSGDSAAQHVLVVGGACADHADERYARADDGPVVCVPFSDLTVFERPEESFRQARIVTLASDDLEGVDVHVGGRDLRLSRTHDGYHYVAEGHGEGEADAAIVGDWLSALGHITPLELVVVPDAALDGYGLAHSSDSLSFTPRGDAARERVSLGSVTPDGQWMRRGDENAALRISTEDAARLALTVLDLQNRQLIVERESSVASITLTRAGSVERLERGEGRWQLTSPHALDADGARVSSLARKLAQLSAVRFVSARALPEQGLASPSVVIDVRYEGAPATADEGTDDDQDAPPPAGDTPAREHRIKLGASTPEGVYAQLDDGPAVFLLPADFLTELSQPYVSRDLLRSTATQIGALVLTTPTGSVSLRYEGMSWMTAAGPADRDRTDALLEAVHALRATSVEGYLPAAAPMTSPQIRVEVTRVDDAEEPRHYVVDIAAAESARTDGTRDARREDVPVDLRVPGDAVQTLLDYHP